jgi:ferritin-like metal-binding protein YciE
MKTEHYEMVSYQGLITLASELGNQEALSLLSENLAEEENAAQLLEREGRIRTAAERGKPAAKPPSQPSRAFEEPSERETGTRL